MHIPSKTYPSPECDWPMINNAKTLHPMYGHDAMRNFPNRIIYEVISLQHPFTCQYITIIICSITILVLWPKFTHQTYS